MLSYLDSERADAIEKSMKDILDKNELRCGLEKVSERPPMNERRTSLLLALHWSRSPLLRRILLIAAIALRAARAPSIKSARRVADIRRSMPDAAGLRRVQ